MIGKTEVGVLLVIVVLAIVVGKTLFSTVGGFSTLAVSFLQKGIMFPGETTFSDGFIITATANQGSDTIFTDIDPSLIKTQTGKDVSNRLQLKVQSLDENALYEVTNLQNPIVNFKYYLAGSGGVLTNCPADEIRIQYGFLDVYCFKEQNQGTWGKLQLTSIKRQAVIGVSNGIESKDIIISSSQSGAEIPFGTNIGAAKFEGSLVTGNEPPSADVYTPYYDGVVKYWKLANPQKIAEHDSSAQTVRRLIQQWLTIHILDKVEFENAVSFHNGGAYQNLINQDNNLASGCPQTFNKCWTDRTDAAKLLLPLDWSVGSPVITFKLKATWVGIKIDAGIPKLSEINCHEFESGTVGSMTGKVTNIGQGPGVFDISLLNCPSFTLREATNKITVGPGQTSGFNLPISSGRVADNIQETCNIRAVDQTGLGGSDQVSTTCKLKPPSICTPGSESLEGTCVFECKSDGSGRQQKFCCDQRVILGSDSKYKCDDSTVLIEVCGDGVDNNNNGKIDEVPPCQPPSLPITEIIALLIFGAITVSTYAKGRDRTNLILGAMFGSIAAIIFYVVVTTILKNFWLILLGSIAGFGLIIYLGIGGILLALIISLFRKL